MRHPKIIFIFLVAVLVVQACRKDYTMVPPAVELAAGTVSFDTVILPILVNNCAKSGCHVSGGQTPDLTAANAYTQLTGLGYVPQDDTSGASAKNSILYKMITSTSKPMPPTSPLSGTQVAQILAWIKQGSLNN
jgi:hypothetical protein